jgi:hypothetical protein
MQKFFYHLLIASLALLPLAAQAQQDQINVLYIAASEPADGGDAIVIDSLEELGYNVTELVSAAYTPTSHTDFGADVIVFGEALGSGAVVPFFDANFPVPCVSMEGFCVRENRWQLVTTNDDFGQVLDAASMPEIVADPAKHFGITVNVDHPITAYAGLSVGESINWANYTDSLPFVTYFDLPQVAATAVADIQGETDRHTLWALEPDATDATNPLSHRLVIWGVHENGLLDPAPAFFDILDGAILWVMNMNDVSSIFTPTGVAQLTAQPNPFQTTTDIAFSLDRPGEISLQVLDLTGRTVATQRGAFGLGNQRMTFARTQAMAGGIYHFSLQLDGKPFGAGKLIVR